MTRDVRRLRLALSAGNFAMGAALGGPLFSIIPRQLDRGTASHASSRLALVTAVGACAALLANLAAGTLSDRVIDGELRRERLVVLGLAFGGPCLAALGFCQSVAETLLVWVACQVTVNSAYAAMAAMLADRVPPWERGSASSWIGASQALGILAGVAVASTSSTPGAQTILLSAVYVACLTVAVKLLRGLPTVASTATGQSRSTYVSAFSDNDFRWNWAARFFVILANGVGLTFLYYYLKHVLHRPAPRVSELVLFSVASGASLVSIVICGYWSDQLVSRRRFVKLACGCMALAALGLALWPTWGVAVGSGCVLGLGFGAFTSVDQALGTQVLPHSEHYGRDLGLVNIANSAPQLLAGPVGAVVVPTLGYRGVFGLSALASLLGAFAISRVRDVP
jgi:MFS family permease